MRRALEPRGFLFVLLGVLLVFVFVLLGVDGMVERGLMRDCYTMSRISRKLLGVRSWGGQGRSRIVRSRVTDCAGW